nr:HAMP domain-containing histidine kinase [Campylobacter sp.]
MRHSLSTKITIVFAIALIVVSALFFVIYGLQSDREIDKIRANQYNSINWLISLYDKSSMPENWERYFKNFDLVYVKDQKLIIQINKYGKVLDRTRTSLGIVETVSYKGNLFLNLKNENISIILQSTLKSQLNSLVIIFLFFIVLVVWLYISILKNLAPLRSLRDDMRKFASGNMDGLCRTRIAVKDEISEVAYEFNNAACKIKELLISRQLFLRTIMHELKTPIGKGRIVSEMLEDDTQKHRLINVFDRLNMLLNEFSKIEQLLSKSYALKYENYHFSLILEQVADMMLLDDFDKFVTSKINKDVILKVDFQLFCLAIKNLIDNAIKYSTDKKAIIECDSGKICIKNLGEKMNRDFEYYKQAFIRENNSAQSGLGLGLYIIENICNMHKFDFTYEYKDGYHIFCIGFGNV